MKAALLGYLASHGRRENRMTNGRGYQFIVFCTCPLCVAGKAALNIKEDEYEVVRDSDPPERVTPEEPGDE
jgi:hypothetical protein